MLSDYDWDFSTLRSGSVRISKFLSLLAYMERLNYVAVITLRARKLKKTRDC